MKTKLIKQQDKFILVSDETIENCYVYDFEENVCYFWNKPTNEINTNFLKSCKKIIAGIPELPSIDFSLLSEEDCKEIGWVDVEKLADEFYKKYQSKPYAMEKGAWRKGFKTAQSFNDKMFSLEELIKFSEYCRNTARREGTYGNGFTNNWELCSEQKLVSTEDLFKMYQSLQQIVWDVEVEIDNRKQVSSENKGFLVDNPNLYKPLITNNKIKVNKILNI